MHLHLPILLLLDPPPCHDGMLIVGWWSSSPRTDAKEALDSVPIELHFYSSPVVLAKLLVPHNLTTRRSSDLYRVPSVESLGHGRDRKSVV